MVDDQGMTVVMSGTMYLWDRKLSVAEIQSLHNDPYGLFHISDWKAGLHGPEPDVCINDEHPLARGMIVVHIPYETPEGLKIKVIRPSN
jgi:hypothetical protein